MLFKRRNALASSATSKCLQDHWRQLKWMITILFWVNKNPITTSSQVKNTLEEASVSLSKSTIKIRPRNRKARLDFARKKSNKKKNKKRLSSSGTSFFGQIKLYQNNGKRRAWRRKEMAWSKADHICQTWWRQSYGMGRYTVWLAMELTHWCLLMMWLLVEAAVWILLYRAKFPA